MTRVYVIRHGRPASSWGGDDGDPGLDDVGRQQAIEVMQSLLALPEAARPRRVVSSPLRRCRETAEPLARALGLDLHIDPRVGEIPTPEALSDSERPAWLRTAFGGEWGQILGDMDYAAWAKGVATAVAEYPLTAVFSHFVALNAAVGVATGTRRVAAFRPDHCSVTTFEIQDTRLLLIEKGREAQSQVL